MTTFKLVPIENDAFQRTVKFKNTFILYSDSCFRLERLSNQSLSTQGMRDRSTLLAEVNQVQNPNKQQTPARIGIHHHHWSNL